MAMPKKRCFRQRIAAFLFAALLLSAAVPPALAADTRTGTVTAPTGILLPVSYTHLTLPTICSV